MNFSLKKLPSALVLVFYILVAFVILTWIVPSGSYQTENVNIDGVERSVIIPGTFTYDNTSEESISFFEKLGQSFVMLFEAPVKGFVDHSAVFIICFVLFIGGAFAIFNSTGAMNAGLEKAVSVIGNSPAKKKMIIALLVVIFSLAGASFGMAEECLIFILITLPLARSMGYDNIVGVAIPFVGSGVGFASAFINPFTLQIAQVISGIQPLSGTPLRLFIWVVFTIIAIIFILVYCNKLDKNPKSSPVYGVLYEGEEDNKTREATQLTLSRKINLVLFVVTLAVMIYGVMKYQWYIIEMTALFLVFGFISGIIGRQSPNQMAKNFQIGASEMLGAAVLIGFAKGILIIAEEGRIIDTILHSVASAADGLPGWLSAQVMFLVQTAVNFIIPSGSGKAALTMPLMAPLSDVLGITRQTAVLAYQFGDGITNLIIPTSFVTLGVLQISRIPFGVWFKWAGRLVLILSLVASLFLIYAVLTSYK